MWGFSLLKVVYKKYILVNGKRYGPYLYHNKRVGQRIITSYHGSGENKKRDLSYLNYILIACFFLLVVLGGFFVGQKDFLSFYSPDERVVFDIPSYFVVGESLDGEISLFLKGGELIPSATLVEAELNEQKNSLILSDLVDLEIEERNFFIDGSEIIGFGKGFGIAGRKAEDVTFQLEIIGREIISDEEAITEEVVNSGSVKEDKIVKDEEIVGEEKSEEGIEEKTEEDIVNEEIIDSDETKNGLGENEEGEAAGSDEVVVEENEIIEDEVVERIVEEENSEEVAAEEPAEELPEEPTEEAALSPVIIEGC